MRVIKTMRPGDRGARRFQRRYGDRLCAVRYRESACGARTLTTIEIIVDERERAPAGVSFTGSFARKCAEVVALRIAYDEFDLRDLVKREGGCWSAEGRAWLVRRDTAVSLGLRERIVEGLVERCTDVDTSLVVRRG